MHHPARHLNHEPSPVNSRLDGSYAATISAGLMRQPVPSGINERATVAIAVGDVYDDAGLCRAR